MNSSVWGYMFLFLGILGIVLINIFGEVTVNNEQNYYSLKEVTKAAMIDAVDEYAYHYGVGYDGVTQLTDPESMHCSSGAPGTIRIIKERFVELFLIKFAQSVNRDTEYEVIFNDIDECPPKVTVTVITKQTFSFIENVLGTNKVETTEADITNEISAILESEDQFKDAS